MTPAPHRTVTARYGPTLIARSDQTVYLEGNHYFPADSIRPGILTNSLLRTLCFWKGIARYHHFQIGGVRLVNAAWSYPRPSPLAHRIKGMIAFEAATGITVNEERPL